MVVTYFKVYILQSGQYAYASFGMQIGNPDSHEISH